MTETKRMKLAKQSLEYANTHDMLVEALDGQIYLKETFHMVNTNQVTGEALKKVSVGGKGGFGSQGDARDQDKQVDVSARVMVMSDPSQEAFNHNVALNKTVIGWREDNGRAIYLNEGESITQKRYVPSHLFGDKEIKGEIEVTKSLGREYNEYAYSNQLDPSDNHKLLEYIYRGNGLVDGKEIDIESARATYDELCGYRGAWKYVGLDGGEQRRYRFTVVNFLNLSNAKGRKVYTPEKGYMTWEASSYNHHVVGPNWALYLESNPNARKDHIHHILHQLPAENDVEEWLTGTSPIKEKVNVEPSEDYLRLKEAAAELERKRRFDAAVNAPELSDWRMVYNWELTKKGKTLFTNEKPQ